VPKDIEQLLVDLVKWADSSEIKCQFTQQEAAYYLCGMLEDRGVELPQYWKDNGGPSSGWWQDFYRKHPELVKGQANRLAEVRVTAHTPAAIKDWFNRIITGEGSKDKFYGMNPKGMEKYLIEQLPHICAEHDNDPQWIKARAKALCHEPRLQTNFDQVAPHPTSAPTPFNALSFSRASLTVGVCVQKGHAIGGSTITILSCKYSRRHCRDVEDGTWCSVCPLVNANGELLFIGFVLKGKLMVCWCRKR
jgi:hypothetical protein